MKTYKIDVYLLETAKGKAFQVKSSPEVQLAGKSAQNVEHALVTWEFHRMPAGLTPVITFNSPAVIVAGPTTVPGTNPKVTFEIKFPSSAGADRETFPVKYTISALKTTAEAEPLPPVEAPQLVIVRTPDPPGGGKRPRPGSRAAA